MSRTDVIIGIVLIGGVALATLFPIVRKWYADYRQRPDREQIQGFLPEHLTHLLMIIHHVLVVLILVGIRPFTWLPYSNGFAHLNSNTVTAVTLLGLALFVLGNYLRVRTAWVMGAAFDKSLVIRKDHNLVTDGPFRLSRHPMYLGNVAAELGLGIALLSWPLVLFTLFLTLPATQHRAIVEEELLHRHFGQQYSDFAREVGRWIP